VAKDRIPTSRLARTARVSSLAAGQAARHLGTSVTNIARNDEGKQAALERRHVEAAEQIVTALGTMKGAAMKLGQVMSFLDVGLVPEEHREEFQRKLGELRDAAPKVRFADMRKVIESELEAPLRDIFESFDAEPIAAASIGQVYRARLDDGRDVAVKVQYPGVAAAVRADMQNLGIILRLMKRIAPGLDVQATAEEIRSRIGDELDYELEATNQRALARIFRGHPFIHVPQVVTSLSRERVMVSEFVSGRGFDSLKEADQATRDRLGEIIFRFYFGCMYRHRQFSGDPHPGNFLLMHERSDGEASGRDSGRVAFLDFGLFKVMPQHLIELELACQRAGHEGDAERLWEIFAEGGLLGKPDRFRPDRLLSQFLDATWWYLTDEEIQLGPEVATQVMIDMSDPRSEHFGQMRHETLPADHIFGRRVEMLTLAVLGQLRATANWHRIAREWMYGDPPVTELGKLEAEFYDR
jgi:predicted unusual protein kinase regulating ubiquinone biosynthesis (AarF/ABC1/UbiB family)